MRQGFADGFATAGIPLRTIDGAIVNGWYYMCPRALGGPPEPSGPPPAFVMWLMFKLHPELRRRQRNATAFFAERRWEEMNRTYFDRDRARFEERIEEVAAIDVAAPDDDAIVIALQDAGQIVRDLTHCHFRGVPASALPIGDFLVHCESWAGADAKHAFGAIAGFTTATSRPIAALDRVVEALRDADQLALLDQDDPTEALAGIGALGGPASAHLAAYQREYGQRIATDYTVLGQTLNELPHLLIANLRQRKSAARGPERARQHAEARAAQLRSRVPEAHRPAWDEMLHAARTSSERREDEGGLLLRTYGVLRGMLLEIGARLVAHERADEPDNAFDLTEAELVALLRGAGPDLARVREHTAARRRNAQLEPPPFIGPVGGPPPIDMFPKEMRRTVSAVGAYVSRFSPDADPIDEEGLAGHGVSPGVIEGRAAVIRGQGDFERFSEGDILFASMTTPSFNTLLAAARGVVTETGGLICHAAIVAREFGIPGVVGVAGVLDAVPHGALVRIDGERGTVEVLADSIPVETQQAKLSALSPG